jgi:hypothetical protein
VQRALRLHHTLLDNRRINVEVTAGGGGKSENRTAKIKMRNDKLRSIQARRTALVRNVELCVRGRAVPTAVTLTEQRCGCAEEAQIE